MVNKAIVIGASVFLVAMLFLISSGITGNVITGSVIAEEKIENEYFRVSDFGKELNEEEKLNDTQNSSGSR